MLPPIKCGAEKEKNQTYNLWKFLFVSRARQAVE